MDGLTLIFDPITEIPTEIFNENKKRIIFVSHAHGDHYNKSIWKYDKIVQSGDARIPEAFYVISDDVTDLPKHIDRNVAIIKPYTSIHIGDIRIETLGSTDQGVSFLVEDKDKTIFFSGDLNWWAWDPKSRPHIDPAVEEADYKREITRLKKILNGRKIDLACVPVDPRLDLPGGELFAAKYFISELSPKKLLPIHFWGDFNVIERLKEALPDSCPTEIGVVTGQDQYVKF